MEAAISPPVDPGQSPGGGPGGKAPGSSSDPAVHSTKKCPQKATFLVNFYLCAAYKLKGKIDLRELSFFSSRGGCGRNGMKDSVKFLIPPWKQQKNC